jgi:hypothetical protein
MRRTIFLLSILAMIGIFALFTGCGVSQPADDEIMVEFAISKDLSSLQTIKPDFNMAITRYTLTYRVSGTDPRTSQPYLWKPDTTIGGSRISANGSATVYLVLKPGTYDFKVKGFDDSSLPLNYPIGSFIKPGVSISPKTQTNISMPVAPITLDPDTGLPVDGDVAITIDWSALGTSTLNPSFKASVYQLSEDMSVDPLDANRIITADPGVNDPKSVTLSRSLPAGYYMVRMQMFDDERVDPFDPTKPFQLWSSVEALRVVANYESTASYFLDYELYGVSGIGIVRAMENPFTLDFWVKKVSIPWTRYLKDPNPPDVPIQIPFDDNFIAAVTFESNAVDAPGDCTFMWFVDGNLISTAQISPTKSQFAVTFGENQVGSHMISVLAKSFDAVSGNPIVSSVSFKIIVIDPLFPVE